MIVEKNREQDLFYTEGVERLPSLLKESSYDGCRS